MTYTQIVRHCPTLEFVRIRDRKNYNEVLCAMRISEEEDDFMDWYYSTLHVHFTDWCISRDGDDSLILDIYI